MTRVNGEWTYTRTMSICAYTNVSHYNINILLCLYWLSVIFINMFLRLYLLTVILYIYIYRAHLCVYCIIMCSIALATKLFLVVKTIINWLTFTLAFHTARCCIFHPCDLLLTFPLRRFSPLQSTPAFSNHAFTVSHFPLRYFQSPLFRIDTYRFSSQLASPNNILTIPTPAEDSKRGNIPRKSQLTIVSQHE